MSDTRVFLRGLFVAGLVAALCTYGLAAGQAANRNQGAAADQNQPGNGNRSATAQPGAAKRRCRQARWPRPLRE